ncbi:MAG: ABC transporter permease [Deltaproteobacteria bacterium]|nr:ABC transporter permease [Deltaproteobacteria bacterium]MBI4223646.1 ABC transporter permease [Deltaproteobacteria bacterium]
MGAYLFKRFLLLFPTLLGIVLITFIVIRLAPGDPAEMKLKAQGQGLLADQAATSIIEETRKLYGLDKPIPVQFLLWFKRVATFDFGTSYKDGQSVLKRVGQALPITLTLNVLTLFVIYFISIPWGIFTSLKPAGLFDRLSALLLFVLYSLPSFWVAMLLIVFAAGGDYWDLFPIAGFISDGAEVLSFSQKIANVAWHLILPVVCLTYGGFAFLARFSRATMLEVIHQDFIRTARAKGLAEWKVILKHGFRNALIPQLTLLGTLLPALLGGSVIIEQIFAIPGMGRLGFEAVLNRDYPVIMAIATIDAFLTLVSLLISDLLYAVVDPRITFEARG